MAARLKLKLGIVAEHDRLDDSPDTLVVVEPSVGSVARSKGNLYLLVTSMAWETTLAVPRHWWGYKPSGMLGIWVQAWTADPAWPFPLEAVLVWFASPFAMVLTYEFVKLKKYLADPAKATYMHPSLR